MRATVFLILLGTLTVPAKAQIGGDPKQKMQEILEEVAQEMQQIDKWLQESSRSKAAAKGMQRNVKKMNELLDNVGKSQKNVVKSIDDLLKEAEKMKQQGQGQPQQSQQSQDRQRQQRQQGERPRNNRRPRQLQRPEANQQPREQDKNGKQQPRNERPETEKGRNVTSKDPSKGPTEVINGKKVQGAWGTLPDYVLKHGRGSMPDVPEKYRKYLEAITKQGDKRN